MRHECDEEKTGGWRSEKERISEKERGKVGRKREKKRTGHRGKEGQNVKERERKKERQGKNREGEKERTRGRTHVRVTAVSPGWIPEFMPASESRQNLICRWLL